MQININSILASQNKTVFYLSKEIDCDYHSLLKLCNGETSSVSFNILEKLCLSLDCFPNDLFIIEKDKIT
jgi:putative transcriptional regulator